MKPSLFMLDAIQTAICNDTATLKIVAEDGQPLVVCVFNDFIDAPETEVEDLVLRSPTEQGSMTDIPIADAAAESSVDGLNGDRIVQLLPLFGSFRWEADDEANDVFPFTLYGLAVLNQAKTEILFLEKFAEPIAFTTLHQAYTQGSLTFRIPRTIGE